MRFSRLFVFALLGFLASHAAHADTKLIEWNYVLRSNVNYTTDLYRVLGAPAAVKAIVIKQSGDALCKLKASRVQYNTYETGPLRDAQPIGATGARYAIPEGSLNAIQISFYQSLWDNVTCTMTVYSIDGNNPGGPTGGEKLLGALTYGGGFAAKVSLALDLPRLRSFRFEIPTFCPGVSVLEAGTVSAGVFYPATKAGTRFQTSALGSSDVKAIQAAVNGPANNACTIPVYGSADEEIQAASE